MQEKEKMLGICIFLLLRKGLLSFLLRVRKKLDCFINSLPNDKIFYWSKLKAFADKINLNAKLKIVLKRVENIVEKGESAGNQNFLLFPQGFGL